jgi:amidase
MKWSFQTAEELVAALRAGAVTSVELTDEVIARIERDDEVINAICVPDFDRARAAAHHADQTHARGEDRPRSPEGLPVGVQLIGPMFEDRTPLRLAELLEQKTGGFQTAK